MNEQQKIAELERQNRELRHALELARAELAEAQLALAEAQQAQAERDRKLFEDLQELGRKIGRMRPL